jgi:CPA2 family monovalent cation:H+ antiporter-2
VESLPFRDAFAVLFFVAVGMLFDPTVVVDRPLQVLAVAFIIIVGKSFAAAVLVLAMRYPLNTALTVSASLAQIGEFSFILAALGASLGVLPAEGQSLVVAGALLSIAVNPLIFSLVEPAQRWILAKSSMARHLEARVDPLAALPASTEDKYLAKHVVLVGYGTVGRGIASALEAQKIPFVVVEQNRERVEQLRRERKVAVSGDAGVPVVLVQAHIATAGQLVVAVSESTDVRPMMATARALNPSIQVIVRAATEEEAGRLVGEGAEQAFHAKSALAQAMSEAAVDAAKPASVAVEH